MATVTSKNLPIPQAADNNDTVGAITNLANKIDSMWSPMTTATINALPAAEKWEGRVVFNTTTKEFWFWDGSIWQIFGHVRGEIREWPSSAGSPPNGWLFGEGANVSRTTYANLFAIYGTQFGVGDGSTTFGLPNKQGRVSVGRDTGNVAFDTIGETGGAQTKTLAIAELPAHDHVMTHGHTNSVDTHAGHTHTLTITTHNHNHVPNDETANTEDFAVRLSGYSGASAGFQDLGAGTNVAIRFQTSTSLDSHAHAGSSAQTGGNHSHVVTINNYTGSTGQTGSGTAFSLMNPYLVTRYIVKY